ncbi:uncharacterized protein V1510DRAFT_413104 [Dipodascopsis tothii]|uniref:uncharacterized protein n=1 Tax=Dipodascopsis tothii TaxID=44089 RepID=UPI0034CF8B7C
MAEQEKGHAELITNLLGPSAATECEYSYPFETVQEFIDFCQKLTKWGESGVYGFLPHLNSRAAAQLLLQSITTEARQQMIFRQFEGLFPMPVFFETAITQSMAWTLLAPYITGCSAETPMVAWQNFPALNITNNPNATISSNSTGATNGTASGGATNGTATGGATNGTTSNGTAATNGTFMPPEITTNRTSLSTAGSTVELSGEHPGKSVGPNGSYITTSSAGEPKYAAWISQLNITFTALENFQNSSDGWTASTTQPDDVVYADLPENPIVNGTMFLVVTDEEITVTPHNISALNEHIVAGPAVYQAD